MKTKKGIFKKCVATSLLFNLALNPMATMISNTVYAEKTNSVNDVKFADFTLEAIDKATGKKISKEITLKVKTHPDFAYWGEEEYSIKSTNGVFDFSVIEDMDNLYTVEIEGENNLQISNIKKDENNLNILKFDKSKKKLRTSNLKGDEAEITNLIFEKKSNDSDQSDKENKLVSIKDIDVVFPDGTKVPDGINFHTFNKENKDMSDYVTSNGKLSGIKVPVGARLKLGISTDKDKYTLKTDNGYENYIWFKVDKNGVAKLYNEVTGEVSEKILKRLVVVKKSDLIGEKPENEKITKKVLEVFDTTSNKAVTEDNIKFIVIGGGETKEFVSKNGKVELQLYKNTEYTINIVRAVEHPYKMSGFKFKINDDNIVENESKEKVEKLNVYQGSYLIRLYVIHGGKHLKKSIDFKIEEVGTNLAQIRKNENNFLNFDAKIGKSYKITMNVKDSEYYLEKPLEFTIEKDNEDGLYWPKVAKGDTSQGENRKVKAVFLKRYDGVDNHIPGLDGNDVNPPCPNCPDNSNAVCEISKIKVKTLPISVKLPEGADKNDIKFKLFNSSKQQYEGEFTLDENSKLPALELFEKNSYFLQLVSNKYFMHNKHFEAVKEGKFPFAFKDKAELKELIIQNNTSNVKNDGTYEIDIKFVKDNKALVNEEIQFISSTHTTKATTDDTGHLKIRLMEDVTYIAKPTNENLIIDTFPIVVKDKTEWGTPGIKYVFDHSSCGSTEIIKVKNKLIGRTNGSITCKPGNTTIKGMDFKDLFLVADHLDKGDYPELKDKDAMVLDLVLLNHVRQNCERSKIAYGDFEILRKIPVGKKVSLVYYLNGNKKEELKFEQVGDIVKITDVHSLGIHPLVIEFEKSGLDIPDNNEKVKNSWKLINNVWFRFDKDGNMLKDSWFEENGKWYYLKSNGSMANDEWILVGGTWYFANTNGRISQNEWVYVDRNWYFANESGRIATNEWVFVNENWYFANESGRISTNEWVYVDGNWYFANESGRIATNEWVYVGEKWYYAEDDGRIAQEKILNINNINYIFDSNGVLIE
ncbi:hypothetical protein [uncultured Parvimonas sp.]|uniref:N-acetylmuramoyl-L-alanine amidase family protein n=1 Tax=uncultured Parvimonas sp. TaxID=747372 RepID=UPI0028D03D65|nr:hypothetical protein [uncultured Parvimonas sp.]